MSHFKLNSLCFVVVKVTFRYLFLTISCAYVKSHDASGLISEDGGGVQEGFFFRSHSL